MIKKSTKDVVKNLIKMFPTQALTQEFLTESPTQTQFRQSHLGRITGSQFFRIKRSGKKRWSDGTQTYMAEKIWEFITKKNAGDFTGSKETRWGNKYEPEALKNYEEVSGNVVKKEKFIISRDFKLVGCTPDAISEREVIEIKCPYGPKAHIETLLRGAVPELHTDQIDGQMLCAEKDFCKFISYDPRIFKVNKKLGLIVIDVQKDDYRNADLFERLSDFEADLIENLEKLEIKWN